jgi:hypothetical protein
MFDQERGEKCGWCNAQDKKIMPCAKLDEVGGGLSSVPIEKLASSKSARITQR